MALFPKASFHQVKLEPDGKRATLTFKARGQNVSLTMDLPNLNVAVAGGLNALRSAQQTVGQLPEFSLSKPVEIDHMIPLPVDKWRVTTVDQLPGQVILHIVAAGGLYLTFSLGAVAIDSIVEALSNVATSEHSNKPKPGISH